MATKQELKAEIDRLREKRKASGSGDRQAKIQRNIDSLRAQRQAITSGTQANTNNRINTQTSNILTGAENYAASQPSAYTDGSLGRIDAVPYKSQIDALLAILGERAANGLTAGQQTTIRETGQEELNRSFLTARDQASRAMPSWRVRGPASTQVLTNLLRTKMEQQQQLERGIALKSIDEASNASNQYSGLLGSASGLQTNLDQFNLGQANAELAGRLGEKLGYGNLFTTTRAGVASENAIRQGNRQSNNAQAALLAAIQQGYGGIQSELERQRQEGLASPISAEQILAERERYNSPGTYNGR